MLSIDPKTADSREFYGLLVGAVGPRPISFASTMDADGNPNLSPFSYFNVFGANPPILIFSPARRSRDNSIKDTLQNVKATREVVINIVNYAMVQQVSLSSTEYDRGVDEFGKSGLTTLDSDLVKPFRVKEAPVQFECRVNDIIALGDAGGAGNLVICEVLKVHVDENILDAQGVIDPHKIDQVARMGGNWYTRAKKGLFEVPKPLSKIGIGVDAIPEDIRTSSILTGNDLGKLGNVENLPSAEEIRVYAEKNSDSKTWNTENAHKRAKELLKKDKPEEAWKVLLLETN